jgi:hypothetical protein
LKSIIGDHRVAQQPEVPVARIVNSRTHTAIGRASDLGRPGRIAPDPRVVDGPAGRRVVPTGPLGPLGPATNALSPATDALGPAAGPLGPAT